MIVNFNTQNNVRKVKAKVPVQKTRQLPAHDPTAPRPRLPTPLSQQTKRRAANGSSSTPSRASTARSTPTSDRPGVKRKVSRQAQPERLLSDSEGSDNDDGLALSSREMTPRKRGRVNRSSEPDPNRRLRASSIGADEEPIAPKVMHGEDLTSGDYAKDYKPAFEGLDEVTVVEVQYPSRSKPERFALVVPLKSDGYKPIEDITETVEAICTYYFPTTRDTLLHESSGYPSRLKRAFRQQNLPDFHATLTEFNTVVSTAVTSGAIAQHLDNNLPSLPLPLIERILSQTYARTVSPRIETVKRYTSGSDNVYGELLPRFVHEIFHETALSSPHVFVDLGSGVGNVVLQAALERGCEAWGIEMMPNPSKLASLQAQEIRERALLWNISLGAIHLLADDFLSNPAIDAVLRRADVIVVNNKVFSPDLNDALLDKFLDLKEGTRVVSLQAFSDPERVITERNVNDRQNLFVAQRREYWSGYVSWTDVGGEWFVQRKDAGGLRRFREGRKTRGGD